MMKALYNLGWVKGYDSGFKEGERFTGFKRKSRVLALLRLLFRL